MAPLALLLAFALGGDVARSLTTAQQAALELLDRSTFCIVKVEDGDGNLVDMTSLEAGYDFLSSVRVRASVDEPISEATIALWREIDGGGTKLSLAPLVGGSLLNLNAAGSYDPAVNPARFVQVLVAVVEPGETPSSGDYEELWEGYVDEVEWGGLQSRLVLRCRDPISRLNDTIIETTSTYGGGSPLEPIEDVMQAILDDHMGSGEFPLTVIGDPDFGIEEYELGNVSVLEALKALADLIGWNLHWRWQESPGEFRLTLYEPVRDRQDLSGFTPDWTFGPDDYYDLPGVSLGLEGVRNAGEVVYLDADGEQQTATDDRSGSVAAYFRRFIRLDERPNRSIQTSAQADALLDAVLDDLAVPPLLQSMDCAFHWPIELCDVHNFTTNEVHYDTTQTLAVFGYEHVLESGPAGQARIRTFIDSSGQPSGGFRRWLAKEKVALGNLDTRVLEIAPSFSLDGQLSVAVRLDNAAQSVRVAAAADSDPTVGTIKDASAQNADSDGFVRVTGLGIFDSTEVAHIGVLAYSAQNGGGREFKVARLRATATTGRAGNTESVADAPSNEVARSVQTGIVTGDQFAGHTPDEEYGVTFPVEFNAAPVVSIVGYRVKSFDSGLGTGADQTLVLEAKDVAAATFTLVAKLVGGAPTLVSDGDDFTAGSDLDTVDETVECNLASLAAAGAYGDQYTVHYSVSLQVTADAGDTFFRATVVVAFDSNDGGGWVERATQSYQRDALSGATETLTVSHATKVLTVPDLTTNDDIRIRIKSITELGDGQIDALNVHGFNVATDGDASEGVTWQEESVAATEAPAATGAEHYVAWRAESAA